MIVSLYMSGTECKEAQTCHNTDHVDNIDIDLNNSSSKTHYIDSRNNIESIGHNNKIVQAKSRGKIKEKETKYVQSNNQPCKNVFLASPEQTTSHSSHSDDNGAGLATIPIHSASHSNAHNNSFFCDIMESVVHVPDDIQNHNAIYDTHNQCIPQEVLDSKYSCVDYTNCIRQTASHVGLFP